MVDLSLVQVFSVVFWIFSQVLVVSLWFVGFLAIFRCFPKVLGDLRVFRCTQLVYGLIILTMKLDMLRLLKRLS